MTAPRLTNITLGMSEPQNTMFQPNGCSALLLNVSTLFLRSEPFIILFGNTIWVFSLESVQVPICLTVLSFSFVSGVHYPEIPSI